MLKLIKNIIKQNYQENKKNCGKVDSFLQQVKQGPYYVCTICHRNLYQRSVRLRQHEKYNFLTTELYHPVKSFDEKLYICETCHKHLTKNEIPCQAVCNKMALDPIPNQFKDFKKKQKKFQFPKEFCLRKQQQCMEKVNFLKLREAFVFFQQKLQMYAIFYQSQQFPMD